MTTEPDETAEVRSGSDRLKRVLRPALALLAVVFVVWAFRDLARRWDSHAVRIAWGLAVASLVPLVLGGVTLAVAWKYLIERMAATRVPLGASLALHAESQLARYIPGKVGIPVVRMTGAKGIGVPAKIAGSSVLIELMSFVSVGGMVGFGLLAALGQRAVSAQLGRWAPVVVSVLGAVVLLLIVVDRNRCPERVRRAFAIEGRGPLVPRRLPVLHALYWLTWAAHGYLVTCALGADAASGSAVAGVFILAPIVGFLALAAPAGAGVREAVLSIGLVPVVGAAPALTVLVLSRGATLIADVLVWLLLRRWRIRA
ncbi:MAG: flippase-like domain-containing protein [Myxococcales bacterium]|nr:flippase-like domain-containing protein [Myxococcales bacterium]